jgi:hypothetical protein
MAENVREAIGKVWTVPANHPQRLCYRMEGILPYLPPSTAQHALALNLFVSASASQTGLN